MKKRLLLFLAIPCLLSAQVTTGEKRTPIQWLSKLQTADGITLRAESVDNLPDSTYTYYYSFKQGKDILSKIVGITYDKSHGWVVQEKGYTDYSQNGLVDDDFKVEYTYQMPEQSADFDKVSLIQEAITYMTPYQKGVWNEFSREVIYYNVNNIPIRTSLYYPDGNGGWGINEELKSIEYDGRDNPTVLVSSYSIGAEMRANVRIEIAYDGQDRVTEINAFVPGKTAEWEPYQRVVVTYDSRGNYIETYFRRDDDGEWQPDGILETVCDDRGNVISETEKWLDENGEYYAVWIDTYRHVYLPDAISSVVGVEPGRSSVVYPNPSKDYVTVSLQDADQAFVTLSNIAGKIVDRRTIGRQATIAVDSLPPGIYLLTVKTAGKTDVHKLIVK
jgi:hypothetical protein